MAAAVRMKVALRKPRALGRVSRIFFMCAQHGRTPSLRRFMARRFTCLSARVSLPWMVLACALPSLPSSDVQIRQSQARSPVWCSGGDLEQPAKVAQMSLRSAKPRDP